MTLPTTGFVRQAQLLAGIVPFSASTLWRRVSDQSFPAPVKLSAGVTAWRVEDVRAWMENQPIQFCIDRSTNEEGVPVSYTAAGGGLMPKKPAMPKESLADWVRKGNAAVPAKSAARPPPPAPPHNSMHLEPEDTHGLPRYIPVTVWIKLLLGEHAPHQNTLLRWVHDGRIQPQPVKTGRFWYVRKDAAYIPDQ